jgi:hypothetical protein
MASSASSERAFSSAGITISKRLNRLKGDIFEALQFTKCLIFFKVLEALVDEDVVEEPDVKASAGAKSWDIFVDDDPDNYEVISLWRRSNVFVMNQIN